VAPDEGMAGMNRTIGELVASVQALITRITALENAVHENNKNMKECYEIQSSVIDDHEIRIIKVEETHKGQTKWTDSNRGLFYAILGSILTAAIMKFVFHL
jgi:hypothetical protein